MNTLEQFKGIAHLSDNSRVWVYQSDRPITSSEVDFIEQNMSRFIHQWAAHGKELFAGYEIVKPFFLIVAVDDTKVPPSGCSIDASVHFIQDLQKELNIDFFQRMNIVYEKNEDIHLVSLQDFIDKIQDGELEKSTPIYQNLIQRKAELTTNWKIPANQSWVNSRL